MKADSVPTNRNRNAFYTYRKRPSPSPSVCSSASSSAASSRSVPRLAARGRRISPATRLSISSKEPVSQKHCSDGSQTSCASLSAEAQVAAQVPSTSALPVASTSASLQRKSSRRTDSVTSTSLLQATPREFEAAIEREYQDEVIEYMATVEEQTVASVELIDQQPELEWYMRPFLIDFLVEIHSQYRLRPETLYLAVNIADRYTGKRIVYKRHYQLVGCAALWIAAKFEDAKDRVPTVQDLCAMTCNAYDASAFIQMEGHVLSTLNWLIGHPTAESWLRVASISDPHILAVDSRLQHVARFLMEITLFHRAFVPLKSSDIALGCLLLARYIRSKPRRVADETPVAVQIAQMLDGHLAGHLEQISTIVVKKYALPCFSSASNIVQGWYLAGHRFALEDWPSCTPATLAPISCAVRRDSAGSSIFLTSSSSSSSPSSFLCSSSDDDDAPLTPSTPLTQYDTSESDYTGSRAYSSPLATRQPIMGYDKPILISKPKEITPPNTAASLKVKLVPTSGPAVTLC